MEIKVIRKWKKSNYTVGQMFLNGELFCNTLEDKDRGLASSMTEYQIKSLKIKDRTAIPTGTYSITLNVVSPKFSKKSFYMDSCKGRLPRLLNVKGFDGILIHVGDGIKGPDLTSGCILVGKNTIAGGLTGGRETFRSLYAKLSEADKKGEKITISIQ